jgi:hypothetical protein
MVASKNKFRTILRRSSDHPDYQELLSSLGIRLLEASNFEFGIAEVMCSNLLNNFIFLLKFLLIGRLNHSKLIFLRKRWHWFRTMGKSSETLFVSRFRRFDLKLAKTLVKQGF